MEQRMSRQISTDASSEDVIRKFRAIDGAKREFQLAKERIRIKYVLLLIVLLYITMFPARRITHYFHKTLVHYWPEQYAVPSSYARISFRDADGNTETVSLEDLIGRVAPNHGLELQKIAIRKDDFVKNCDGCIEEPLRLFDIGHKITPDWSNSSWILLSEVNMVSIVAVGSVFALTLMFQRDPTIRTVSFFIRAIRIIFTLHALRPFFHVITGLPGPPLHCQSSVIKDGGKSPHLDTDGTFGSFLVAIFSPSGPASCGDLIFSGHMINATTMLLLVSRYAPISYPSRKAQTTWITATAVLFVLQMFLILAARNHYFVDILTSVVVVLLFARVDLTLFPDEEVPPGVNEVAKVDRVNPGPDYWL